MRKKISKGGEFLSVSGCGMGGGGERDAVFFRGVVIGPKPILWEQSGLDGFINWAAV